MENFQCQGEDTLISHIIPNPKNNNKHSVEQIKRLAKIIEFQGQRSPIVVSNRSGFVVKGHARLMALKELGWERAVVDYQEYKSEAQEYADMTADNEIARWAELDREKLELDIKDLEDIGSIDLDFLGMKYFQPAKDEFFTEEAKQDDSDGYLGDPSYDEYPAAQGTAVNKQIILVFSNEEFAEIKEDMNAIMEKHEKKTVKELFLFLLEQYETTNY